MQGRSVVVALLAVLAGCTTPTSESTNGQRSEAHDLTGCDGRAETMANHMLVIINGSTFARRHEPDDTFAGANASKGYYHHYDDDANKHFFDLDEQGCAALHVPLGPGYVFRVCVPREGRACWQSGTCYWNGGFNTLADAAYKRFSIEFRLTCLD